MLGVCVHFAAVERSIDELFEGGILALCHLVEVDKLGVDVVYYLTLRRLLGEQYCATTAERLGVESVLWDQREDMFEEGLLTSIVGYWCFHRFKVLLEFQNDDDYQKESQTACSPFEPRRAAGVGCLLERGLLIATRSGVYAAM